MTTTASLLPTTRSHSRWFYSVASLSLLVIMFVGFQMFYLQGRAYPGRPLTPHIRTLLIIHGCLMTAWILLAVAQPLLVSTRHKRLHMKLGIFGVMLASAIVVAGVKIGVEAARVTPPEVQLFGLNPKEFMTVPVLGIILFGLFVLIGVMTRRRPEVHRPVMLIASVSVMGAAFGRIAPLPALYAGTWWEVVFGANFMTVILAAILLIAKCLACRSFDRWFAAAFVALTGASVAISLSAKTQAWDQFATFLLQL
jgi:small basic protein